MAYRLSFLVVPRSVNSRTSLLLQHHEAVELQQAVPCNLVNNIDTHGLLTKREVNWPSFVVRVYGPRLRLGP